MFSRAAILISKFCPGALLPLFRIMNNPLFDDFPYFRILERKQKT